MKKFLAYSIWVFVLVLAGCETRTFDEISGPVAVPETVSYSKDVKPVIDNNCTACHSSGGASSFYPLTDYQLVKNAIDNILDRVQRPSGDPQKMPQGGSLSSTQIEILKKWKNGGMLP